MKIAVSVSLVLMAAAACADASHNLSHPAGGAP